MVPGGGDPAPLPGAARPGEADGAGETPGLHTALDTSGFLGVRADDAMLDATDLVLLDVKSWDPATYRQVTRAGSVTPTLRFGRRLADRGVPIWVRFVLVPGLTDDLTLADSQPCSSSSAAGLGRRCSRMYASTSDRSHTEPTDNVWNGRGKFGCSAMARNRDRLTFSIFRISPAATSGPGTSSVMPAS
ncbi:radical SAM protein [Micromonospora sp. NBC_00421]|uniref:radical SAM protein n=1 Tax=Micromonospora sp. NBC_00421 TaxID=2975976 RepID=UPI002E249BB0